MKSVGQQVAERSFSAKTIAALARLGITLIGTSIAPCGGLMRFGNGEQVYCLNDNGTHRVRSFMQVLELAR